MNAVRVFVLCSVAVVLVVSRAPAQDSTVSRAARVTYLTSASAYVDAGREHGLREGTRVEVIRGGAVVAVLKVAFLASRQASCEIVRESVPIAVGDSVRFDAVVTAPPLAATAARAAPRRPTARRAFRGRVGARYLVVAQENGAGFSQPSLDVRLDGPLGGWPVSVAVDVRARRTYTTTAGTGGTSTDGATRAYQLAMAWRPAASPYRLTVGRQLVPGLATVGPFDGVLAERDGPEWGVGVFTGSQPEPTHLGFATDIVHAGGFVQRRGRPRPGGGQWSGTLGVSGSYQNAHANREFVFVQGAYSDPRWSAFFSQEIDYYRTWKRAPGAAAVSWTSTFATLRYRATPALTVHAGFDNRRNVLLYRDVVNPLTVFDDAFRQGVWLGMGVQLARRYRIDLDARQSRGGDAGRASAYTLSLGASRLPLVPLSARLRSTYYENPLMHGWLHSGAVGADAGSRVHGELSGGLRIEADPLAVPASHSVVWLEGSVDVILARAWYVVLSGSRERNGPESYGQLYAGLSVRF